MSQIDVYTISNTISQQRKETEIQFLLCMIQKALEKHSNTFIVLHVSKNMAVKLSFDEGKWLLKCYWKVENVVTVQRCWRVEFGTPPSTRVTITRIRVKFEVNETVQDVSNAVMQVSVQSPKKSLRQYSCEIGIEKSSVHRILRAPKDIPLATIQMVCCSV